MSASVEERVAAGVAWLDEHAPDWVGRIDLERLDLTSPCRCILGQTVGDFWDVIKGGGELFGGDEDQALTAVRRLGFDAIERDEDDVAPNGGEFRALDAEWRRVILARRAEAVTDHG
jgi:hypothetical protein